MPENNRTGKFLILQRSGREMAQCLKLPVLQARVHDFYTLPSTSPMSYLELLVFVCDFWHKARAYSSTRTNYTWILHHGLGGKNGISI